MYPPIPRSAGGGGGNNSRYSLREQGFKGGIQHLFHVQVYVFRGSVAS